MVCRKLSFRWGDRQEWRRGGAIRKVPLSQALGIDQV